MFLSVFLLRFPPPRGFSPLSSERADSWRLFNPATVDLGTVVNFIRIRDWDQPESSFLKLKICGSSIVKSGS
ncbi:hypothetical protein ATANTOWER_011061 [Ataeniobius toweri]|uniref:Uncharacterized protein n=1 Tax=Ataeniobius toweri TaxID=208326 RepID=A0ABU7CGS9_9TELE|nr:hypothetical protein [Ataeniobius toweri]